MGKHKHRFYWQRRAVREASAAQAESERRASVEQKRASHLQPMTPESPGERERLARLLAERGALVRSS